MNTVAQMTQTQQAVDFVVAISMAPKYPTFNSGVYAFGDVNLTFEDMDTDAARRGWIAANNALFDGCDPLDQGPGIEGDYEWIRRGC